MPNICYILLVRCIPHGVINLTLWLFSSSWASTKRATLETRIDYIVSHCGQLLFKGTWQTSRFSVSVTQEPDLICLKQSLSFKFTIFLILLEAINSSGHFIYYNMDKSEKNPTALYLEYWVKLHVGRNFCKKSLLYVYMFILGTDWKCHFLVYFLFCLPF